MFYLINKKLFPKKGITKAKNPKKYKKPNQNTSITILQPFTQPIAENNLSNYITNLDNITSPTEQYSTPEYGYAKKITIANFPILTSFSTAYLELYDNSMRAFHHHNAAELGYLISGHIQVFICIK